MKHTNTTQGVEQRYQQPVPTPTKPTNVKSDPIFVEYELCVRDNSFRRKDVYGNWKSIAKIH